MDTKRAQADEGTGTERHGERPVVRITPGRAADTERVVRFEWWLHGGLGS
jgi:hypothetical protein